MLAPEEFPMRKLFDFFVNRHFVFLLSFFTFTVPVFQFITVWNTIFSSVNEIKLKSFFNRTIKLCLFFTLQIRFQNYNKLVILNNVHICCHSCMFLVIFCYFVIIFISFVLFIFYLHHFFTSLDWTWWNFFVANGSNYAVFTNLRTHKIYLICLLFLFFLFLFCFRIMWNIQVSINEMGRILMYGILSTHVNEFIEWKKADLNTFDSIL